MKSVLFCLLGIALVGTAVAQVVSLGKGCSDAEAEKCNLEFLTFGFSSKLPDTASKLADYCKKRTKALQCALNYTDKCLIGVYRGTAFTAINTMREENDRRCNTSHVEHTEFLQHSKCLNKAGDPIHKCIVNFKKEFYTTAVNAERKDRIRYGCCDYTKMFHCREKNLRDKCNDPQAILFARNAGEHILGNALKIFCGGFTTESKFCKALPKLPRLPANTKVPKSVMVLLKTFATL
ncbi:uncharacterized protein LOC142765507 [Rhipicephalus microplus]|uniref:uncharacterized protein LOC142765507 n=1 Tax=Rhipicephalus microplus TaxID=6941 RepID=UPI003F6D7F5A